MSNISFDNHDDPLRDITIGSLETTAFISYSHTDIEEIPLHIITNGRKIIQLKFFFPENKVQKQCLRELKYRKRPLSIETCPICLEEKKNNVHVDDHHFFCIDCLIQYDDNLCPICRQVMM